MKRWRPGRLAHRQARHLRTLREDYGGDPRRYWDARHRIFATSLRGVGAVGVDDADNARDYAAKLAAFSPVVGDAFSHGARTALDAGCGIGVFSECLVEHGYQVTAVDFSDTALAAVRERTSGVSELVVADLAELDLRRTFDLVVCIDVLFHVVDDERWRATVDRLAAHTAPAGRLVIQEHLADAPGPSGVQHVRWRTADDYADVLGGLRLETTQRYELPAEDTWKDLMVWRRP